MGNLGFRDEKAKRLEEAAERFRKAMEELAAKTNEMSDFDRKLKEDVTRKMFEEEIARLREEMFAEMRKQKDKDIKESHQELEKKMEQDLIEQEIQNRLASIVEAKKREEFIEKSDKRSQDDVQEGFKKMEDFWDSLEKRNEERLEERLKNRGGKLRLMAEKQKARLESRFPDYNNQGMHSIGKSAPVRFIDATVGLIA